MKQVISIVLLLFLSACGIDNAKQQTTNDQPLNVNYGENGATSNDEESESPNFLTNQANDKVLEKKPNHPNVERDVKRARTLVEKETNFRPGSIIVNGDDMWITVYDRNNDILTRNQKIKAEAAIHRILEKVLPHYDIEIKVDE